MHKHLLLILLLFLLGKNTLAQQQPSPQERSVQLSATTQTNPPQINLEWKVDFGATKYIVYRKALNDTNWGNPIANLSGSATSYVDNNVQVGVGYEYAFFKEDFAYRQDTVCVPSGTSLKFTINDSNGIGVCCSFGDGFYEIKNCNNIVASGAKFGFSETTDFTTCNDGSGCSEIYITVKPSMIENSTSWTLQNNQTGQTIANAGGAGQFIRPRPEYGFIYAGIELPAVEDRGRILLVVENDLVAPLATEIDELKMDFIKDGWRVSTINVDRNDAVSSVLSAVKNVYNSQTDLNAVLLLGHVPIAFSGSIFPDTHTENEGAYPADVYYGEMNGTWTDNTVNVTSAFLNIYHNVPGDGKFDQDTPPSGAVELQVGRVDFFDMSAFGQTEVQLMQQYLNKNHQFKTRQINPTRRALIDDNIGHTIAAPAASGYRNFATMFGADNIFESDYFGTMSSQSYLWSYGAGSGDVSTAAGVGTTNDFANSNLQNVFTLLFGSQFGNWAFGNNLLRAPLASGQTLTSCYAGNPPWVLHHMSMGYHIGYSLLKTQNNTNDLYLPYGPGLVSTALMGDPTLRMHMVQSPTNLQITNNSNSINLNWNAPSNETLVGYHIYRAASADGIFQKINNNTITSTSFVDNSPMTGDNFYLIKTLKLEMSGSGTYYNLSLGLLGNTNFTGTGGGDMTPPTVTIATANNNVNTNFTVNIFPSEEINGLTLSDFNISNGTASNLSGGATFYSMTITPSAAGLVTIFLPSQKVTDLAGNANTSASNTLNVTYTPNNNNCNTPTNTALNKASTQHSTQFNAIASRANDENTDGNFWGGNSVALTNWTNQSWWEVDLGGVVDITEIRIFNRTDCCQDILKNYHVFVSENPFNSMDLNATLSQNGVVDFFQNNAAGTPTNLPINTTGRYVRVQLSGQGFLALAEVEVMGCFVSGGGMENQTINFDAIPNKLTTDAPFMINASASSNLPVSFSVVSGGASISGNTITLNGTAGLVTIQASQSGNAQYNSAPTVTQSFMVSEPSTGGCSTTNNIALTKTATQSGTQFGHDASQAIDGNTDGNFWGTQTTSLTNWVANAWLELDLGEVANIETINLWNRTDCCQDLFGNYYVLVSDAPFASQNLNSTLSQVGVSSFLKTETAARPTTINVNRTGRYVRVQLVGTAYLAITELEVMGCMGDGGCPTAGTTCDDNNPNTENDIEDGSCNCAGTPINSGCTSTNNLALNKNTSQSSTLTAAGITGSASKAVDGNSNGVYFSNPSSASSVSATNNESQAWWEVDLGNTFTIENINIFNRTDGSDKTQNCYVLVSDTPFGTVDLATARSQAIFEKYISGLVGSPSSVALNVEGRYVRVQLENNGHLVLAEVEVVGCGSTSPLVQSPQVVDFQVVREGRSAQVLWSSNENERTDYFIIEKSNDGEHFYFFQKIENTSEISGFIFYKKTDNSLLLGSNYYRLKLMQSDGSTIFSQTKKVSLDADWSSIFIFPNPAKDEVRVNLKQYIYKNVNIQILDTRGMVMEEKSFDNLEEVQPVFDLRKYENGLYVMAVKVEGLRMMVRKFVVERGD